MSKRKRQIENITTNYLHQQLQNHTIIDEGVEDSYIIEADEKYFLKFLDSGYFEPEGFLAGGRILNILSENTNIPVTNLITISEEIPNYDSEPFYITDYIDGYSISGYDSHSDLYYKKLFKELGNYIAQLNNVDIDCEQFGWAGWFDNQIKPFGGHNEFKSFLIQRILDSVSKIEQDNPMISI